MSNDGDESPSKSIDFIILQEEILRSLVFLWGDEDIFAVFREKLFAEPFS